MEARGENRRENASNGLKVKEAKNPRNRWKCRAISKNSESNRSRMPTTHNLKVTGSNPSPPTKNPANSKG